jgi:general secretion pathway protein J
MTGSPARTAGFTLLELLVAMTVLGVLTGLLATGLSFGTRIWEREQHQVEQATDLQMVQDVIRRTLGEAWPLNAPTAAGAEAGTEGIAFVGTDKSIEFLGPPPAQSLVGGVYQYVLLGRDDPGGVSLVLTWRLRSPDGAQRNGKRRNGAHVRHSETAEGQEVVLVDRLVDAEFSYFGAGEDDVKPRWRDRWKDTSKLPLLVRLQLTFPPGDRRRWPELVVAPAITGTIGEG